MDAFVVFFETCTWAAGLCRRKTHGYAHQCPYKVGILSLTLGNHSVCPWLIDFPISHVSVWYENCESFSSSAMRRVPDYLLWVEWTALRVCYHHLRIMPSPTKASQPGKLIIHICVYLTLLWTLDKYLSPRFLFSDWNLKTQL